MYESFYGLKEKPFTLLPDPDYLYLSPKHQRALTLLEYGMMNQAGFSVICGDTGAGKTTLIRRLLSELGDDTKVGLITNTHQSFGELLNWVLMAFGLDGDGKSKAQMHQMFISFLIEQYASNKHTVLIVDEAQNMSADTLEELRMLSNINADKDQVLQVILAGQPTLRETLRKPELMQFAQRIAVDYYLESLSVEETQAYIRHRLSVAGSIKDIFTKEAGSAIFKYSGGTPRLINLLCDTALVYGFAEQSEMISEQLVHDVVREQHSNSIIPTFNTAQTASQVETQPANTSQATAVEPPLVNEAAIEKTTKKHLEKNHANGTRANLSQQSVQQTNSVVSGAVGTNHAIPVSQTMETDVSENAQAVKDESNVTPIKVNQAEAKIEAQADNAEQSKSSEDTSDQKSLNENQPDRFTDTIKSSMDELSAGEMNEGQPTWEERVQEKRAQEKTTQKESTSTATSVKTPPTSPGENLSDEGYAGHNHPNEDVYPIVHIEENPKKGISVVLIALVGGMFVASIAMMVAAWMMFGDGSKNQQSVPTTVSEQVEKRELKALEKERDAALAVTRALERERDAALQAAKAQEKIRAAELKASEILAAQEREAAKRLKQAQARAREAEKAEMKAIARERQLKLSAEKREAELEQQRLNLLREERIRLNALAAEEQRLKQQQLNREQVEQQRREPAKVKPVTPVKTPPPKAKKEESFSANPCNSPSAKFLSTCKK